MRASLRASLAQDPTFEGYAKGSIVICPDCWKPIYRLERGISPGDRAGRAASAFAPLRREDCLSLATRPDLDATWRQLFVTWWHTSPDARRLIEAQRPRAGDVIACPLCDGPYIKPRTVELADTHDRAYVLEMATIAPLTTRQRNPFLGGVTRWIPGDPDEPVEITT